MSKFNWAANIFKELGLRLLCFFVPFMLIISNFVYLTPLLFSHNSSLALEALVLSWIMCIVILYFGLCVVFSR